MSGRKRSASIGTTPEPAQGRFSTDIIIRMETRWVSEWKVFGICLLVGLCKNYSAKFRRIQWKGGAHMGILNGILYLFGL